MEWKTLNLAQIYAAADEAKMRRMQMENYGQEMRRRQKDEQDLEALKQAYAITPDGVLDEQTTLGNLYRVNPMEAYKFNQGVQQNKLAQKKLDAEERKLALDEGKAKLESRKALLQYGRDRLAGVQDQAGYEAVLGELAALGGGDLVQSMNPVYSPEAQQQYLLTADEAIKRTTPKWEKIDLGGKVQLVDVNPITNPAIRDTPLVKTASPDAMMNNERMVREGELNRAVTMRGQNITRQNAVEAGQRAIAIANKPPKTALSSSAQKELFEADEMAQASQNTTTMLKEALKLNDQAYSGIGAKERAVLRSNLPGQSEAADATINLDNLMTGQALESLKATFGAAPTEGERKILMDMQASADKTPKQRREIINRAIQAAERRMKFNRSKADALRKGTYFTDGVQQPEPAVAPAKPGVIDFGSLK